MEVILLHLENYTQNDSFLLHSVENQTTGYVNLATTGVVIIPAPKTVIEHIFILY